MIKGTTPTHIFTLPFDTGMIKTIQVAYAQGGVVMLTKGNADCTFDQNMVSVRLSQEDTFLFAENACVEVQVRVLTMEGEALASGIMRIRCKDILTDEVLT